MRGTRGVALVPIGVATALLTFALAGTPLYGSSAGSAALARQLAGTCRSETAQFVPVPVGSPDIPPLDPANRGPAPSLAVETTTEETLAAITGELPNVQPARRIHRTRQRVIAHGSQFNLEVIHLGGVEEAAGLEPLGDAEIALTDTNMQVLGVSIGDRIAVRDRLELTVAQRFDDPPPAAVPDFWCGWAGLFELTAGADAPPPSAVASPGTIRAIAELVVAADYEEFGEPPGYMLPPLAIADEYRLTTDAMTLEDGRATEAAFAHARDRLRAAFPNYASAVGPSGLPTVLARAEAVADTVDRSLAPVQLTALAAVAVVLVAACVLFARSRHRELQLYAMRGLPPRRIALTVVGPAAAAVTSGASLGLGLAWGGVLAFGPAPVVDPGIAGRAVQAVVLAVAVLTPLVAGVVAWIGDRSVDHAARPHYSRWLAGILVIALAGVAVLAFRRLDRDGGVRTFGVEARGGSLLAIGFPLFALLACVTLTAALLAIVTPALRLTGGRLGRATRLGWRRVVLEAGPLAATVTAVALAVGCFATSRVLAEAGTRQLHDKAEVYVGSDLAITLFDPLPAEPVWVGPTSLQATAAGRVDGNSAQLVGIDRTTFTDVARLRSDAADRSLPDLLATLGTPASGPAPTIAVGSDAAVGDRVTFAGTASSDPTELEVVALAEWFPGYANGSTMYVVDRPVVEAAVAFPTEILLVRDPPADAIERLHDAGVRTGIVRAAATAFDGSAYDGLHWAYLPLGVLGLLFAVVALAVQLLVAAARAAERRATHAVMRHTSFGDRSVLAAAVVETTVPLTLGALLGIVTASLATRLAVPRLDPMPTLHPIAQFATPWAATAAAAVVVAVWSVAVAGLITWATVRLDAMEVLHGDR